MEERLAAGCLAVGCSRCLSGGVGPPDWAWQDGERGAGQRLSHGAKHGSRFIARHRSVDLRHCAYLCMTIDLRLLLLFRR